MSFTQEQARCFQQHVEDTWKARVKSQYLTPGSSEFMTKQAEFFCGAMAAMQAMDPDAVVDRITPLVPPWWVINLMACRSIVRDLISPLEGKDEGVYAVKVTKTTVVYVVAEDQWDAEEKAKYDEGIDWSDLSAEVEAIDFAGGQP